MKITLTEDEKRRILGLHGSNLIMEQSNPKVTQIQTYLKGKGYDLGTSGPNKDGVDGQWGNKTLAAVKTEFKVDLDDKGNIKTTQAPTPEPKPTQEPIDKIPTLTPTSVQSNTQQTQLQGTAAAQPAGSSEPRTRG